MEKMENNEIMVTEELNNDIESVDYDECEGGGLSKFAVGLGILGVGAAVVAGVAYKCKDKLEERRIEKLRKKGYVIFREDEVAEVRPVEDEDVFEEEDTSEAK